MLVGGLLIPWLPLGLGSCELTSDNFFLWTFSLQSAFLQSLIFIQKDPRPPLRHSETVFISANIPTFVLQWLLIDAFCKLAQWPHIGQH